ncbi:MAG: GAF domain-containing SpoIIE family protein phosphatase [Spirochaetota bacterium]
MADKNEQMSKLQSLLTISSTLNTNLNIHQLLPIIMLNAKDLLEAEASSLFLWDEIENYLYCEVALGEKGEVIQQYTRLEMGVGVVGWVAQTCKPVLLRNAYDDERFDRSWDKKFGFTTKSLICVPLFQKGQMIGTLEVLNKTKERVFDENDLHLLTTLADMAAIAIENASLTENLKKRITELTLLYDFEKKLGDNLHSDQLGAWLLDRCLSELGAKSGSILLWDESKQVLKVLRARGIPDNVLAAIEIRKGWGVAGWIVEHQKPLLIPNIESDPRFEASRRLKYENQSLISVPLLFQERLVGVFNINNKKDGYAFNRNDLHLAQAIADRLAMTISSAQIFEQFHISSEENLRAQKLMRRIIPTDPPNIPALDIAVKYFPYMEIGGDFFQFLAIDEKRVGVIVVDVSGHGLSASLLAVMVHTMIDSFDVSIMASPARFLIQLNRSLFDKMAGNFLTAFYAVINHQEGEIKYAKAGHPEPILLRTADEPLLLRSAGKIVGALPDLLFEERSVSFAKGDSLLIYTDGLTEAANWESNKVYEQEKLLEVIQKHCHANALHLADRIIEDIFQYTEIKRFPDDVTLIILKLN